MAPFRQDWSKAGRVGPEGRSNSIDRMRRLIMESEGRIPDRCPMCECMHIVRYGKTSRGTRRYRCRGCGRTFSSVGVISGSRLTADQWMRFAECYVDGDTLDAAARICGVSKTTVRRMRASLDGLRWEAIGEDPQDGFAGRIFYSSGTYGALKALRGRREGIIPSLYRSGCVWMVFTTSFIL